MRKRTLTALCLLVFSIAGAQTDPAKGYASLISEESLRDNLSILASDALEGRETGKRGQKMAAAFIRKHFEDIGLSGPVNGDYYQKVPLYAAVPGEIFVKVGNEKYKNFEDVLYYGRGGSSEETTAPVIFGGFGTKEELDQLNVEGKAVLIAVKKEQGFREPAALARERKAKMIILFYNDAASFEEMIDQFKRYMPGARLSLSKPESTGTEGVFFVSQKVASAILSAPLDKLFAADQKTVAKKFRKLKAEQIAFKAEMLIQTIVSENVLGYLEGTDKKDELIVMTAHYDHIGKKTAGSGDRINNGADDDGSGTVGVMDIANAFAQAKKDGNGPRRSILFMTVTGEEKGLLGSDYYTQNPVFPLGKTIVNLNIDMVGRRDPQHKDSEPYVYVIGSDKLSSQLHALSESVNKQNLNLAFDYTYNDQNHPDRLYYRSDHWNFAKNNIPIIFYFDGIHEDYHKPSDEVEKIEFDLLRKRIQTVFYTAWELANRDEAVRPDAANQSGN